MSRFLWLLGLAAFLTGCETPGKGPVADAGYRNAALIIAAIDKFYQDHGRYPATLHELIPRYLRHVRQVTVFNSGLGDLNGFEYYPQGDAYELSFAYYTSRHTITPGYHSKTRKWETVVILN